MLLQIESRWIWLGIWGHKTCVAGIHGSGWSSVSEVPVKKFGSKEAYGTSEFYRKATSVCGGHSVEMRHHQTPAPHTETLDLPRNAKRLLQHRWLMLRGSIGSKLWFQDGKVMIAGSQRQVWAEKIKVLFLPQIKYYSSIVLFFYMLSTLLSLFFLILFVFNRWCC